MDNTSLANKSVLSKCLSLLPFNTFSSAFEDWGVKKLTTPNVMRIFVAAQLGEWESYSEMEEHIRARRDSEELFGLSEISGSQLSRRLNQLPTSFTQSLFHSAVRALHKLTAPQKGLPTFGKLHVIDSSSLHLGEILGKWAYVTKNRNQVKLHTRIVVSSPDEYYPDRVIPSTGNVDDREVVPQLVTEEDATALLDRGYVDYTKMDKWIDDGFYFAMRINNHNKAVIYEKYEENQGAIKTDAKVVLGKGKNEMTNPLRLVEFYDDEDRFYRIITNRWDLSTKDVTELYKCRWKVELFFKWMKQHLRVKKLHSTKPQGIWNQIFFALTAYCLSLCVRILECTDKSSWDVLKLLRIYTERTWQGFRKALHREPQRESKGRQKTNRPRELEALNDGGGVAFVKPVGEKRSKTAKYFK